jgi:hypothetical protein
MGYDDLGTVIDLMASYNFNKNVSGTIYWGHVFGGDVIKNIYQGDENGDLINIEVKVSF